jgi:hypothetical protein
VSKRQEELREQYVNGIVKLTKPYNRTKIEVIRDADMVIDMHGKVLKDRYGAAGKRNATADEKAVATEV